MNVFSVSICISPVAFELSPPTTLLNVLVGVNQLGNIKLPVLEFIVVLSAYNIPMFPKEYKVISQPLLEMASLLKELSFENPCQIIKRKNKKE